MLTVTFKNGSELKLTDEIFEVLNNRLANETTISQFQTFKTEENEVILLINMWEVIHIKKTI